MANSVERELAALINAYARARVAISWKGSRPVEEWWEIEQQVQHADKALTDFISNSFGLDINL